MTPQQVAAMLERQRKAERKASLEAAMLEEGITVKTPEQRVADDQRRKQEKAAKALLPQPQPRYEFVAGIVTMAHLLTRTGPYGDTAAAFAIASCARTWACDGMTHKGNAKANPSVVIRFAFDLHIEQIWRDAGIVRYDRCALDNLKGDSRRELDLVVAQTLAEWQAAGSPGLDTKALNFAHRFLHGFIWVGALPSYPECPPPAHTDFGIYPTPKEEHCS